jgi:6-phosphofructokinase
LRRLSRRRKTIDNDVPGTDDAFGFDTALSTVVRAVEALHATAESHHRVLAIEVRWCAMRPAAWTTNFM